MKTTELFAELLVIGVGAFCACLLLLLAVVPEASQWVAHLSPIAVVPSLAVIYLFGILADRISDIIFDAAIGRRRRGVSVEGLAHWKNKRDSVVVSSPYIAGLYAYSRSRQRILRAWTLNSVALAGTSFLYLATKPGSIGRLGLALLGLVSFLVLGVLCFVIWNRMDAEEVGAIDRIARQAHANLREDIR